MSQRMLSCTAAAVLMTTALSWNLPAAAQGAPVAPSASRAQTPIPTPTVPPRTTGAPAQGERGADHSGGAFGGGRASLPADLTPPAPDPAAPASAPAAAGMPAPRP
ncbi:MAG TPA: hypothetical protein PKD71_12520 [Ottowia sp.]|nr:hypothetical protein [Ottowia sp.]